MVQSLSNQVCRTVMCWLWPTYVSLQQFHQLKFQGECVGLNQCARQTLVRCIQACSIHRLHFHCYDAVSRSLILSSRKAFLCLPYHYGRLYFVFTDLWVYHLILASLIALMDMFSSSIDTEVLKNISAHSRLSVFIFGLHAFHISPLRWCSPMHIFPM